MVAEYTNQGNRSRVRPVSLREGKRTLNQGMVDTMIDVVLVDGHRLVLQGLRCLLVRAAGEIRVVAAFDRGEDALIYCRERRPDVVITELSIPGVGGLGVIRRLRVLNEGIRVIVLTAFCDDPYPIQAFRAGASAFLDKGCESGEVVRAVRSVHAGRRYVTPEIAGRLVQGRADGKGGDNPFLALSRREFQVVERMVEGHSLRQIARRLHVAPNTVATYRSRIYDKLGVSNEMQLARLAIRHGFLEPEPEVDH